MAITEKAHASKCVGFIQKQNPADGEDRGALAFLPTDKLITDRIR